ncbi:hypothetical protein ACIP86_23625 [Pseudomonas neuropathica]
MGFTERQAIDHIYNSSSVVGLYHFAMRIGFWPDFPDPADRLATFLAAAEVASIEEIDNILELHRDAMERFLADVYANRLSAWRVTPEFLCELALLLKYPHIFTEERLVEEMKWDIQIAKIVLTSAHRHSI